MRSSRITVYPLVIADNTWTLPYLSLGMVAAYLRGFENSRLRESYDITQLILGGPEDYYILYYNATDTRLAASIFDVYSGDHSKILLRDERARCPNLTATSRR